LQSEDHFKVDKLCGEILDPEADANFKVKLLYALAMRKNKDAFKSCRATITQSLATQNYNQFTAD